MVRKITMAELDARVAELLAHADKMRAHIKAHEFDLAALEARALELYCRGTNSMANALADAS